MTGPDRRAATVRPPRCSASTAGGAGSIPTLTAVALNGDTDYGTWFLDAVTVV